MISESMRNHLKATGLGALMRGRVWSPASSPSPAHLCWSALAPAVAWARPLPGLAPQDPDRYRQHHFQAGAAQRPYRCAERGRRRICSV